MIELTYLFGQTTFEDFDGQKFSYFKLNRDLGQIIVLNTFLPIMSKCFKMHEAMILTISLFLGSASYLLSAYTTVLWQFYLAQFLDFFYVCLFSAAR